MGKREGKWRSVEGNLPSGPKGGYRRSKGSTACKSDECRYRGNGESPTITG